MTYLEKTNDEQNNLEYVFHFNQQDALLIRSIFINQNAELIEMIDKPPFCIKSTVLKQIEKLIQIDKNEILFRIEKLTHYINLLDHAINNTTRNFQPKKERSVFVISQTEKRIRRI